MTLRIGGELAAKWRNELAVELAVNWRKRGVSARFSAGVGPGACPAPTLPPEGEGWGTSGDAPLSAHSHELAEEIAVNWRKVSELTPTRIWRTA